jgi:hypothetical protein
MTCPNEPADELTTQLDAAAAFYVERIALWLSVVPPVQRRELAGFITQIVSAADRLQKAMPPGLDPSGIIPSGMQLYGLLKGYEAGKNAVARALRAQIPELAPLADALEAP